MPLSHKVVLITGAAHRIGAHMARVLHGEGANIVLHYRHSRQGAEALCDELQAARADSVSLLQADLHDHQALAPLVHRATEVWGRLDCLINNASSFYETPLAEADPQQWDELLGSNLRAPFFLCQAAAPALRQSQGSVINIVDIHATRPLKNYPLYSIAKAGLVMLTKSMACELGPEVRVNGIAPGAILWPEQGLDAAGQEKIISRTFLKRQGSPDDIAKAALYLIRDAGYMSGQILTVDGGRSMNM